MISKGLGGDGWTIQDTSDQIVFADIDADTLQRLTIF
jgi:hypothetical protein